MKFYAIGYSHINGKYRYFGYTCKFLSERTEITEDFYDGIRINFPVAGNKNDARMGIYFDKEL